MLTLWIVNQDWKYDNKSKGSATILKKFQIQKYLEFCNKMRHKSSMIYKLPNKFAFLSIEIYQYYHHPHHHHLHHHPSVCNIIYHFYQLAFHILHIFSGFLHCYSIKLVCTCSYYYFMYVGALKPIKIIITMVW